MLMCKLKTSVPFFSPSLPFSSILAASSKRKQEHKTNTRDQAIKLNDSEQRNKQKAEQTNTQTQVRTTHPKYQSPISNPQYSIVPSLTLNQYLTLPSQQAHRITHDLVFPFSTLPYISHAAPTPCHTSNPTNHNTCAVCKHSTYPYYQTKCQQGNVLIAWVIDRYQLPAQKRN